MKAIHVQYGQRHTVINHCDSEKDQLLILFNFHQGDPSDQMFIGEAIKLW
jgi:hypothetical protein